MRWGFRDGEAGGGIFSPVQDNTEYVGEDAYLIERSKQRARESNPETHIFIQCFV
jgi:hypothetical protein